MKSVNDTIPKPLHIIGNVSNGSIITSLDFFSYISKNEQLISIAIFGTKDSSILIYSLKNYRLLLQIKIKEFLSGGNNNKPGSDDDGLEEIKSCLYVRSKEILMVQLRSGLIGLFHMNLNRIAKELPPTLTLIVGFKSYAMTFATSFVVNDQYLGSLDENNAEKIVLRNFDFLDDDISFNLQFKDDEKHGIIISLYCIIQLEQVYFIIAFESGFLELFRSTLTDFDGEIKSKNAECCSTLRIESEMILSMDFNQTKMFGVLVNASNDVCVWRLENKLCNDRKILIFNDKFLKRISIKEDGLVSCSIRSDGKIFAIGTKNGRVRVFSGKTAKLLAVLTHHFYPIRVLKFTENLNREKNSDHQKYLLFVSSYDKSVSIWSLYND